MKRIIALVLTILLVFAFAAVAGCSAKTAPEDSSNQSEPKEAAPEQANADTQTKPAETAPASDSADKTVGGGRLVAFAASTLNDSFLNSIDTTLNELFSADGYSYTSSSAEGDATLMINQIENFVTMGAACILACASPVSAFKEVLVSAMDAGCYVVLLGMEPRESDGYEVSGVVNNDNEEVGRVVGEMAIKWVTDAHPEASAEHPVKAAVLTRSKSTENVERCNSIINTLNAADNIEIVYTMDLTVITIDEGYSQAESALTMDTETYLFASFSSSVAIGVNNYIMANIPAAEQSKYAVFGSDYIAEAEDLVTSSSDNDSVLRGICNYGDGNPAVAAYQCMSALLNGTVEPPYYCYDETFSINSVGYVF